MLSFGACNCAKGTPQEQQSASKFQNEADEVVGKIIYMQDPRLDPPTCFAYYWGGAGNGGPALATVPCEHIPRELLATASLQKLPRNVSK